MARAVAHIPEELTRDRLKRLGEGIGKVVYASEHWVVKRRRTPAEVVALIILWRFLRKWAHALPLHWGDYLLKRPSRVLRLMRMATQATMAILPRSVWFTKRIAQVLRTYRSRELRGEKLARAHLTATDLIPEQITFPPAIVVVGGWPGWMSVAEATERVDDTLDKRLQALAEAGEFETVSVWLSRFLDTRQAGWSRGLFSVDAHLKNFGIIGDRIVLLDNGGLTDRWSDISARLSQEEELEHPHKQLGLEKVLAGKPDLAREFDRRWKSIVNRENVLELWPLNSLGAE